MTEKRQVGRPKTRADEAPGEYVGFRAPRPLKEQLAAAAAAAGRSLSTEAQSRLERSFSQQSIENLFSGRAGAILARVLITVFLDSGERLAVAKGLPVENWLTDEESYEAAMVSLILDMWRQRPDPEADLVDLLDLVLAREQARQQSGFIAPEKAKK